MAWQTVVRGPGEGEQILFKVGLMTFKASSADTDGHFALIETVLPPGASVEPHDHPEAEWWYVLDGEFRFYLGQPAEVVHARTGAFLSVPPYVRHAYEQVGRSAGRLLGMLLPGGDGGLETFFRQVGILVRAPSDVPDVNLPIAHWRTEMAAWREAR